MTYEELQQQVERTSAALDKAQGTCLRRGPNDKRAWEDLSTAQANYQRAVDALNLYEKLYMRARR